MAESLIGATFTFQVLFVDGNGDPIAGITDAAILVFSVDSSGNKTIHAQVAMNAPVPAETGRFVYPLYLNPNLFTVGQTLYAEFTATDPGVGTITLRDEETLDIVEAPPSVLSGLRATFYKGG